MKKLISIVLIFILLCGTLAPLSFATEDKLITYDGPSTLKKASEIYKEKTADIEKSMLPLAEYDKIKIKANGDELFVYATGVAVDHAWNDQTNFALPQRYTPVTYFDFTGTVNIEIDVEGMEELCTDGKATLESFSTATVSPQSRGITPTVDGKKITFTITEAGDYTVVLGEDEKTAIHIFTSAPEEYDLGDSPIYLTPENTNLPEGWENASAVVFTPGEYVWGNKQIIPRSNQTVCFLGGAVVHSNIRFVEGTVNAKVVGRGILDDSESPSWKIEDSNPRYVPINCRESSNIEISGISILNPCLWAVQLLDCDSIYIDNLHIITGKHNGDGISVQSSTNVEVKNSFVRGWDDNLVVKNYTAKNSSDISFNNITLWTDLAQSMEIGYETNNGKAENAKISNVLFEDITVIYNLHKPVISIHNADDALVQNITYRNITVENANMGKGDGGGNPELIELSTKRLGYWAETEKRGNIRGVLIENLTLLSVDCACL